MNIHQNKRLSLVHSCRTIGVVMILIGHANKVFNIYFDYDWFNTGDWTRTGGLDFFFIVTGFMIYYLYYKNVGVNGKAKEFFLKRIIKIYPVYWLFTLATLVLIFINPQFGDGHEKELEVIIKNILLFPTIQILDTTWSLTHVVFFYLLFGLLIYKPKILKVILLSWITTSILVEFGVVPNLIPFVFSFSNLEIVFGSVIAHLVMNYKIIYDKAFIILGVMGYLFVWINNVYGFININEIYFYFISASLIMLGVSLVDMKKETKLNKSMRYLGDASYSIFVSQLPVIHFYVLVLRKFNLVNIFGYFNSMILVIVFTILTGCVVYSFIEKPVSNFLKSKVLSTTKIAKIKIFKNNPGDKINNYN